MVGCWCVPDSWGCLAPVLTLMPTVFPRLAFQPSASGSIHRLISHNSNGAAVLQGVFASRGGASRWLELLFGEAILSKL